MTQLGWVWNFQWVWDDENNIENCSGDFSENMYNTVNKNMYKYRI